MATLQDRFNINSQLEHLQVQPGTAECRPCTPDVLPETCPPAVTAQAKYVGTGHADLSRFEWAVNIHRDSYASYVGHHSLLSYFAIAENESIGRVKYNMMQKMLLPCGLPPEKEEEV